MTRGSFPPIGCPLASRDLHGFPLWFSSQTHGVREGQRIKHAIHHLSNFPERSVYTGIIYQVDIVHTITLEKHMNI